jgi:hypothetical protein
MLAMYVLTRTAYGSICLNTVLGLALCSTDGLISHLKPATLYGILFYFCGYLCQIVSQGSFFLDPVLSSFFFSWRVSHVFFFQKVLKEGILISPYINQRTQLESTLPVVRQLFPHLQMYRSEET